MYLLRATLISGSLLVFSLQAAVGVSDHEAMAILDAKCGRCHLKGSTFPEAVGTMELSIPSMLEDGWIVPGKPEESEVYDLSKRALEYDEKYMKNVRPPELEYYENAMPPDDPLAVPLTAEELDRVKRWIVAMPEKGSKQKTASGTGSVSERDAALKSESATEIAKATPVSDKPHEPALEALRVKCLDCHGGKRGTKKGVNVTNIKQLIESGKIVPGEPENSSIFTLAELGSKHHEDGMPPLDDQDKYKPMDPKSELEPLRKWIISLKKSPSP